MPDSSIEQILRRAVHLVAPDLRPGAILDEALRNAGMLNAPADSRDLQIFVMGPLVHATAQLADKETAERLVAILNKHFQWRSTAVGMRAESDLGPTSTPPDRISAPNISTRGSSLRPRAATTLSYIETGQSDRPLDVMIYDPDASRADPIAAALADHELFAAPVTDLDVAEELCASVGPALILYPIETHKSIVQTLHRALDRSDAEGSVFRSYGEAGAAEKPSQSPDLRYRSVEQLVDRIVHLLGDRERTVS